MIRFLKILIIFNLHFTKKLKLQLTQSFIIKTHTMASFNLDGFSLLASLALITHVNRFISEDHRIDLDENEPLIKFLECISEIQCPCCIKDGMNVFAGYLCDCVPIDNNNFKNLIKAFLSSIYLCKEDDCKSVFQIFNEKTCEIINDIVFEGATVNGKDTEQEKLKVLKEIKDVYAIFKLSIEIMDTNDLWEQDSDEDDEDEDDENDEDKLEKLFPDPPFRISIPLEKLKKVLTTKKKITIETNKIYHIKGNNLTYEFVIRQLIKQGLEPPNKDHYFLEAIIKISETKYKLHFGS